MLCGPAVLAAILLTPEAPADGASVGPKPRFLVRAEGAAEETARLRIELSRDGFRTIDYRFDQLAEPNGWAYTVLDGGGAGAILVPRQPLARGDYLWRVAAWDGIAWRDGAGRFRLNVDDIPPAAVAGLTVRLDAATGCVQLSWDAVALDARGGAERIALYHVYRAPKAAPARAFELPATAETAASDCDADPSARQFYRVVAEDEAGNYGDGVAAPPSAPKR